MPFNGSGTFTRVYSWTNDAANSINITASRMDTEDNGFATGLSDCVTRDGQSPWTANIPAGGFKITGLTNGSASGDSAALGQVFQITNNLSEGTPATIRTNISAAASGANTDITSVLLNQTGLVVKGATANTLTIQPNETMTAGRTLNIVTGDATRTLTFAGNATISGTNSGDQTITLTGDVTGSGTSSFAATVASSAITNAKMANMGGHTYKGNNTGSSAAPADVSVANLLTDLGFVTSGIAANGTITLPGGLILKWGDAGSLGSGGTAAVTFGTAFPTNLWSVVLGAVTTGGNSGATMVQSPSTSGFTWFNPSGTTYSHTYWIAIGN